MTASIYLDTNVFISAYESTDVRASSARDVLEALAEFDVVGVTSELTLAELLPKPLSLGQFHLASFYEDLLSFGVIRCLPVTRSVLIAAARLRATDASLKLPDAVHLATARQEGCTAFLSGDRRLSSTEGLQILRLDTTSIDDIRRSL